MPGFARTFSISPAAASLFAFALPPQRRFTPIRRSNAIFAAVPAHLADPGLRNLFALAFLLTGAFVTTYNCIGFRLAAPPSSPSQATIGLVFVIYFVGATSSAAMGEIAGRFGRRRVSGPAIVLMPLGVLTALANSLPLAILGVGLVTAGFFGGHSLASSWVALRVEKATAQASGVCLFFYYAGSSSAGTIGGWVFARGGWPGVAAFVGALSGLALIVAMKLARVPPPAHLRPS